MNKNETQLTDIERQLITASRRAGKTFAVQDLIELRLKLKELPHMTPEQYVEYLTAKREALFVDQVTGD